MIPLGRWLKKKFLRKPNIVFVPAINLTDIVVSEYKDLLLQIRQMLEKHKYNDEVKFVDNALNALCTRNSMDFVKNVAGNDFWGGAMSVSDFCFYNYKNGEMTLDKQDNRQMRLLMHRLSCLLIRDGAKNPRIEALGELFAQSADYYENRGQAPIK